MANVSVIVPAKKYAVAIAVLLYSLHEQDFLDFDALNLQYSQSQSRHQSYNY
jgi:hypothetical protein